MIHPQQLCFVRTLAEHCTDNYSGVRVLEVGSFDVNGTIMEVTILEQVLPWAPA